MSNKAAGIALGAGALTAAGVAFYGAQIPTAQIYGRTNFREPSRDFGPPELYPTEP